MNKRQNIMIFYGVFSRASVAFFILAAIFIASLFSSAENKNAPALDPAAWGENHAGQPLPQIEEGGSCLFCHRGTVGIDWDTNRHNKTVRLFQEAEGDRIKLQDAGLGAALLDEIAYVVGDTRLHAYLKPSEGYGAADLLNVQYDLQAGNVRKVKEMAWRKEAFNESCAGCHATGFDTTTKTYQALTLDCYTCHGQPEISHTANPEQALFNDIALPPPRVEMSICGSCHIRSGKSKSTGQPHANNYMPGDNLFQDLEVDWSDEAMAQLNPSDRHIMLNIREVVLYGNEAMACTTCHGIHKQTSLRHRKLQDERYCFICHTGSDSKSGIRSYEVHSEVCGY